MKTFSKPFFLLTCFCGLSIIFKASAQEIFPGGGSGSYNMTFPSAAPCTDNLGACNFTLYNPIGGGSVAAIKKGATYNGPFQSHMWWTSALWNADMPMCINNNAIGQTAAYYHSMQTRNMHSEAIYPMPSLILQATATGYVMRNRLINQGGGGVNNTGNFFADEDIEFGFEGDQSAKTEVMDYGDMHATFQQEVSVGYPAAGNKLKMSASQGSPYVFFTAPSTNTAEPSFELFFLKTEAVSTSGNSIVINRKCCPSAAGDQNIWGYIGLFFPPGTTISNDGITYFPLSDLRLHIGNEYGGNNKYWRIRFANLSVTNYFTSAIMTDPSQAALDDYETYAFNHITASTFTYSYNEATATLTSNFNYTTSNVLGGLNNGTLMTLFMHQYLFSPEYAANATTYTYASPRGWMRVMRGNQFSTVMTNYGILPGLGWANTADKVLLKSYIDAYATRGAVNIACGNPVYGSFGSIHEAARIAITAHQSGNIVARNSLLTIAKNGIEAWLTSPSSERAGVYVYDPDFNWLTPYPSAFDADRLLQDSHFHHGYLVFAAAIVAKYEPAGSTWVSRWGPMLELVIRNINSELRPTNTSPGTTVPWIPYLRYYDPYVGHSWAGSDASNQESVSEAINFAAGVAMWGETTGNTSLRDMGLMMYITETETARMYWWDGQRRGVNNGGNCGYAPNYAHYHGAILARGGIAYATYFGASPAYVHGITYVPITGASVWMGVDSLGAANNYADYTAPAGAGREPNATDGFWGEALLMQKAVFNGSVAKNQYVSQNAQNWAGDDYKVDAYNWITTFDSVGVVDNTQADIASFTVFRKDTCKHYMIYNPRINGVRTVHFTDGQTFTVPADTIITYKVCTTTTLPLTLLEFNAVCNQGATYLNWATSQELNVDRFDIERSINGKDFSFISTVQAKNSSSSISNYADIDPKTPKGISYYRLKMVDLDGSVSYSRIVAVNNGEETFSILGIYPNPVLDYVTIKLFSATAQSIQISMTTIVGQELMTKTEQTLAGVTELTLPVSHLAAGTYALKVTNISSGSVVVEKIVKY